MPEPRQEPGRRNPASPAARPAAPARDDPALRAAVEGLLAGMIALHDEMIAAATEHRAAIASADAQRIGACVARQGAHATALMRLDAERARLLAMLGPGTPTIGAFADRLPDSDGRALRGLAAKLREKVAQLSVQTRVIRTATESLLTHTHGLVAQIARALSPTGTYAHPGLAPGARSATVLSGLDLTT